MNEDDLKTGKLPARPGAVKLQFSAYANMHELPAPPDPDNFGHEEHDPPIPWGLLGNAQYGDCVVAGGAHEHMLWAKMGGKDLTFNTPDVLKDFQAITGMPLNPYTGADMQKAASYRQKTGLLGADGQRHKIAAYVMLHPGDLHQLYAAIYLFGAVGIGFRFTSTAKSQFANRQAWSLVRGSYLEPMGHYVPCMAVRSNIVCVTWGRFQAMRPSFYQALCDEAIAYVSEEALIDRKSPEGFAYDALMDDLKQLGVGA